MNVAATMSACTGVLAAFASLYSIRVAGAPSSGDQRWFAFVALTAAVYAFCNLPLTLGASELAVAWMTRVQLASALLHVWGWIRFSQAFLRRDPGPVERLAARGLLPMAIVVLVPGAALGGPVVERPFPALAAVYRQVPTTALGNACMAAALLATALLLVRFGRAALARARHAPLLGASLTVLLALGANDALAAAGRTRAPFLLDVGFALPVLTVWWVLTTRFVESSLALESLREDLEGKVRSRTEDLSFALDALHQTEKLAALGQFAAGVAHEVNSPAAVVTTNLRYLDGAAAAGTFPADVRDVLGDALASMKRINDLVRKLVDAGRIAMVPGALTTVSVADVARQVLSEARAQCPASIALAEHVPEDLFVRARRDSLEQVLGALVANAVEAAPEGSPGLVSIQASRSGGTVRVTVTDDGAGMEPDVLRRAFDPFFTTKPPGRGTGLGLPVARGLAEASGGTLKLRSEPGAGTTAVLELPDAPRPIARPPPA